MALFLRHTTSQIEREVAELKARGVRSEECDVPGMKTKDGIVTFAFVQLAARM